MADPMAAVLSDMMVRVWGTGDYWREETHTGGYIDWAHARPACTLSWLRQALLPSTTDGARVNKLGSQIPDVSDV